jgi:hypothetical protein
MFDRDVSEDRDWWAFVRIVSYDPELWGGSARGCMRRGMDLTGRTRTCVKAVGGCSRWPWRARPRAWT